MRRFTLTREKGQAFAWPFLFSAGDYGYYRQIPVFTPDYRNIHPLYLSRNNNLILYYMNICKYLLRGG